MILFWGVIFHLVGDYMTQSSWMANNKVARWTPAIAHGVVYTLPFLILTRNPIALAVICVTHILIDHYRWAKQLSWLKNWLAPREVDYYEAEWDVDGEKHLVTYKYAYDDVDAQSMRPIHYFMSVAPPWKTTVYKPRNIPWSEAKDNNGYDSNTPVWMSTWLMIITDNTVHIIINSLCLLYLAS